MANLSDILAIYTKIILVVFVVRIHTVDPDRELVHDGTIFGIFTASNNDFSRENGVRNCISWGGNLATIRSLEEDQEVFKLTDSTHYQCWIGLEENALSPGAEGYSWVDGSNSLYRKFSSSASPYNRNFMKFRPNNGRSQTEGWIDDNINDNTNCYLCGRLANSRGCGFNDSGFCYRTYQMDTTIDWYDAQSNCVDWGGNLASITSAAENEIIYRRRPFTGNNCWIGMYTTVNGNSVWNDGTALSYTNWLPGQTTSPPSCVEWNDNGGRGWLNRDCNTGLQCYICKRAETTVFDTKIENEVLSNNKVFGYFTTTFPGRDRNTDLRECIGWGGLLASIASASEDELLYNLAAGNDTQCWIGLEISNRGSDSIIWVDGSDSSYRNYPGETPSTTTIDKYYSLRSMNRTSTGGWDAVNMAQTLSCFYCQKIANQRGCDFTNNGYCYRTFETNTPINWDDSQSSCVIWGGNLASITSQQENDFLHQRTPYSAINCWIGLTDINRTNGDYAWIDGEQFLYNNWASGAPVNTTSDDCARTKINGAADWNTFNCIDTTGCYICKRSSSIMIENSLQREFRYDDLIVAYFTTSQIGILQTTALQECFGWGGSLVTVTLSEVDQMLYDTAMGNDVECWIGLEISTRGSESIIWVDGSDSSYRNYPGMIPNKKAIAKYYALRNRNGAIGDGWVSRNPQETLSCYFCGKLANSRGCQLINDGHCYRTFETNNLVNWDTAQANCVYWGGNLASITSQAENVYLYGRTPYTATDCWIGMYDNNGNGSFSWNDGEALSYTNWVPMVQSTGNCVVYKVGGNNAWNNSTCSTERMCYTCKRDEPPNYNPQLEREVTHNGFIYSYHTVNRAGLFRGTELRFSCIFRGGSLATIESLEVDQLLYDLAVSNDTECWIGLEKRTRGIETSIWEDGSLSSYRKIQGHNSINDEITQYYSLRARNGNRTDGWAGLNQRQTLSCSICQRPVNIRECQFTNNGFCYRTFQLISSTAINWYDAQSNCVMWGGNLASITSENENTLLYLRTPYSAVNCWIGLTNANMNNGSYYWIDGEMLNYNLWTAGAPNNVINADDCARNRVLGRNEWNNFNCTTTNEAYICKRSNTARFNPDVGELFGELINGNIGYKELALNAILYRNVTLICGDVIKPSSSSIDWIYSANNDQSVNSTVSANSFNSQSGITYISATLSQQGFYQCRIQKQNGNTSVYTVGVFDLSATTVAESGRTYNYTIGIDRENIQLLCTSTNNSIDPINYRWRLGDTESLNNPLMLANLLSLSQNFICKVSNTDVLTISLNVQEAPVLTVTYQGSFIQTYTQVYPYTIQLSIQGLKQDFTLSSNIEGRWRLPDGSYRTGSTLSYPYLIQQYTGLYTFYLYNWDGVEVPAIQVNISIQDVLGTFLRNPTTNTPLISLSNGFRLFITDSITTVFCVGPNVSSIVEWYIHSEPNSTRTLLTADTGVSIYNISINNVSRLIYLTCEVDENDIYTIFVARNDTIVQVFNFDETVSFTLGSPSLLYYSNASIPDSLIRWTTETVMEGDEHTFNPEYTNPVPLSTVFSDVGGGQHNITCFYRNSPAMVLGRTAVSLRDNANVTLSYNGMQTIYNDANNPSYPAPATINIQLPASNIILTCNLQECIWRIMYSNYTVEIVNTTRYTINIVSLNDASVYSLFRTTQTGNNYTTAQISINVIPVPTTTPTTPTTSASTTTPTVSTSEETSTLVSSSTPMVTTQTMSPISNDTQTGEFNPVFAVIPVIVIIILLVIIVILVILGLFYLKRRKNGEKTFYNDTTDNMSKAPLELMVEPKQPTPYCPAYNIEQMTVDSNYANAKSNDTLQYDHKYTETPFGTDTNYQNVQEAKAQDDNDYEVPQTINPKMRPIPLDVFKIHVNKLWQKEETLKEEYESFGGKEHRYSCNAGTIDSNRVKNRFKQIYPYDKSRVILQTVSEGTESDYINASHIPGIYVENSFIIAQAPKDSTLTDFWQMIIENKVLNIVMVTNLIESGRTKCEPYYPQKEGENMTVGPYFIILHREEVRIGYTIRYLTAIQNGVKTKIKHFHFTAWPDHDVPTLYDEMLLFVEKVHKGLIQAKSPILVHCSAGVGRSGTFVALYNLYASIQKGQAICIYKLVHEMREHRPQMVQTFSQYKFIYLAVLEMLLGNTSIPTEEFTATYQLYMQSENEGYVSVFFQQYSELDYQCEKGFELVCKTANDESNKDKNPITSTLPCDNNRVVLISSHFNCDYINATILDDIDCIVTINPTANTLLDFIQLIYQFEPSLVVFLTSPTELQQIQAGKSDRIAYWPRGGNVLDADLFTLTTLSTEKSSSLIHNKININHKVEKLNKNFIQLISTEWNEKGEPDLEEGVLLLLTILQHKQENPNAPILIHCSDGAGNSGVLLTVYKAILDSREKNNVDTFHIVKKFRSERMHFIPTLTNFVSCFTLMNEFCSKTV